MGNVYLSLQGNMGLSKAIDFFTSHQTPIALPMNDTQKYDLIADFNGGLQRISVKTSRNRTEYGTYSVNLRNTGGSSGNFKTRPFDKNSCDYIFILTGNDKIYLIPSRIIDATNAITVGKKYTEYEVHIKQLSEYVNELKKDGEL